MTLVNSKEFAANQEKFFDMALNEEICIERGGNMFYLTYTTTPRRQEFLEPDEDFYRALPAEEFRKKLVVVLENVDKKYASKCK
ncbi:MAG: hypothetical protein FWC39_06775 [Bacteroidetes bacterium]|nr:hypothetical protein [Bacteroidota bacterium]